jgi:hypothetical protein
MQHADMTLRGTSRALHGTHAKPLSCQAHVSGNSISLGMLSLLDVSRFESDLRWGVQVAASPSGINRRVTREDLQQDCQTVMAKISSIVAVRAPPRFQEVAVLDLGPALPQEVEAWKRNRIALNDFLKCVPLRLQVLTLC